MIRLFKKIFILAFPFLIIFFIIFMLDPYNYFNNEILISNKEKLRYSTNDVLSSIMDYKNNPVENVVLGDSRAMLLNTDSIRLYSGKKFYKLSYGAGNLRETLSTFEYLHNNYNIRNIIICLNFELYNLGNLRDRVEGVVDIVDNPLLYFTNINVIESCYYILRSVISGNKNVISTQPEMSKDDFWKHQLIESASRYYSNYIYPEIYKRKLAEITDICREKNIKYAFVIMPTHTDLQNMINEYNLRKYYEKYLEDLKSFGTVYDFNYLNEFTTDKENFNDPFHMKSENIGFIIKQIFNIENTGYCHQYGEKVDWN